MELVLLVGLAHPPDHLLEAVEDPAVHLRHLRIGHGVRRRVEVVEIPQDEPAGVPDPPVGLDEALDHFARRLASVHLFRPAPLTMLRIVIVAVSGSQLTKLNEPD